MKAMLSAGWPENRAAWLGGQVATNISWQDSGTQAMRPDQSQIVDDFVTIYEPRIAGGRFAPPNIAGSTSCVAASAQNAEGAFLMLAFLTTGSIMAMNEANANGVAPGYKSVLTNPNLQEVSQLSQGLGRFARTCLVFAASAGRLPDRTGHRQRDQPRRGRPDHRQGSSRQCRRGRQGDHGQQRLLSGQGSCGLRGSSPGLYVGEGRDLPF